MIFGGGYAGGALPHFNLKDETFIVPEGFAGIEVGLGRAFTRLSVEFQEWNGRARVGEFNNTGSHDFGFTGYGFDIGWRF